MFQIPHPAAAFGVTLRIAGAPDAEFRRLQDGDQVGGVVKVVREGICRHPCGKVAAQGEDIFNPGLVQVGDGPVDLRAGRPDAGQVREGGDPRAGLDGRGDLQRIRLGGAARAVGHADEVGPHRRQVERGRDDRIARKRLLRRKDFERERDRPAVEKLFDLHGPHSFLIDRNS